MNGHATESVPTEVLNCLSPSVRACVRRLSEYRSPAESSALPVTRLAAVLVLLFEKAGKLFVLLTTRSKQLRSHPGQTALPGGKVDEGERDPYVTARREAFEEVALPLDSTAVHYLCTLPSFLSLYKLVVTPVVAFLSDTSLLDRLVPNEGEVDRCFYHPLEAILTPSLAAGEDLVEKGSEHWPYETEYHNTSDTAWLNNTVYRMHRFRSSYTPVKGLTADVLLLAAEIAYGRPADFERYSPQQVMFEDAIAWSTSGADIRPAKQVDKTQLEKSLNDMSSGVVSREEAAAA